MKGSQEAEEVQFKKSATEDVSGADSDSGSIGITEERQQKLGDSQAAFVLPDPTKSVKGSRRGGGPRTVQGKNRSKQNALWHGILANSTVLRGEPRKQFNSLLDGLRENLQPDGTLEELHVERLASLTWRYRRLLVAEKMEIQVCEIWNPTIEEKTKEQREEALLLFRSMERFGPGLMQRIDNPFIRQRIITLLETLHQSIQLKGFDFDYDIQFIRSVYGEGAISTLTPSYIACTRPRAKQSDTEEERKANFLKLLQDEIKLLETASDYHEFVANRRKRMMGECSRIPESQRSDRFIRYEASLERAFDRTLSQLERIQRIRRGEFVLPEQRLRMTVDSK